MSVKKFDFWTWQVFRKSLKFLNFILTKLSYIRRAGPSISTSTGTPKVQGLIKKLLYDPNGELMTPKSHMPIISKSLMTTNKKRRTQIIGHWEIDEKQSPMKNLWITLLWILLTNSITISLIRIMNQLKGVKKFICFATMLYIPICKLKKS